MNMRSDDAVIYAWLGARIAAANGYLALPTPTQTQTNAAVKEIVTGMMQVMIYMTECDL